MPSVVQKNSTQLRYFIHLSYSGQNYRGWQRQPTVKSVQETIENSLTQILHHPTKIHGCGRTDAGVHARKYIAHLDLENHPTPTLLPRLNKHLPEDIVLHQFIPVSPTAHAQKDAIERTYDYHLHFYKDPFLQPFSAYYDLPDLNLDHMQKAVGIITQTQDFRSLCLCPDRHRHTLCVIKDIQLTPSLSGKQLHLQITADRFLQGMIRFIMARLIEIGRGVLSLADFEECVKNGKELPFKSLAYPQGLYLSRVRYEGLEMAIKGTKLFLPL